VRLLATPATRARNMRVARELAQPLGWFVLGCAAVVAVSAVAGGFPRALIVAAAFAVVGTAFVYAGRRRWQIEDPAHRPSRLLFAAAALTLLAMGGGAIVAGIVDETGPRVMLAISGVFLTFMGALAVVRAVRGE
jgi:hypothetical protein